MLTGLTVDPTAYSFNEATRSIQFTTAPIDGSDITIERDTTVERTIQYETYNNSFRPSTLNYDFDRIWRVLQEKGIASVKTLSALIDLLDQLSAADRAIVQQLIDETRLNIQSDTGIVELIDLETQKRQEQDKAYNLLSQIEAGKLGADLKNYFNTVVASQTPHIFDGITANIVHVGDSTLDVYATNLLASDKKSIKNIDSIEELLKIKNPSIGQVFNVKSYHKPTNLNLTNPYEGGGTFVVVAKDDLLANDGTIFNSSDTDKAYLRLYDGDVDIAWFGARRGEDASPYIEKALRVSKSIVIRNSYTLETICGIPQQTNYAETVTVIRGENQATLIVNCPEGAVFTSDTAKLNPNSTKNLYTGKIDVSGINFIGTTVSNSVIFNGDRLYNIDIHNNNFKGNVTIIKAYLKREAGRQYTQSTSIFKNHLVNVYRVIETDKAYNFDFSYNMCESCISGIYIGVDAPYDPSGISVTINRNLWEGSGLLLKSNGGIIAGSISKNYFEGNVYHEATTEKCLIYINRNGVGAGYSGGLSIENNLFSGTSSIPDYVDVRVLGQSTESTSTSKSANVRPPIFIGNWSNSYLLTNMAQATLINNKCANREKMLNAYSPQEARVTYFSGYMSKQLANILTDKKLSLLKVDTSAVHAVSSSQSTFKTTLDVVVYFKTVGVVGTAMVTFKLDLFIFEPIGISSGNVPKANLKAVMYNFMQSSENDKITADQSMFTPITNPVLDVVDNLDGTYTLEISSFTNKLSPNWGNVSELRIEYTAQSTLIASHTGTYSAANLLTIS
ncbi:hypothetical protein [Acinetobacter oleivorans]|uniref:hypothetical protein n=1 Tax=Acinetobacter oleivorans TaxID=1148157 RepID=UPI001580B6DD|nr:hypothetical protein [Acinetobacter oleivorans]NUF10360.1 hypothetical protein [Acinetobacter oleivorans]